MLYFNQTIQKSNVSDIIIVKYIYLVINTANYTVPKPITPKTRNILTYSVLSI